MTREEVMECLTAIFRDVFEDRGIIIYDSMTAKDVPKWDSLNHIGLISKVEQTFGIRLTTREILALKNVGDLINAIQSKLTDGKK